MNHDCNILMHSIIAVQNCIYRNLRLFMNSDEMLHLDKEILFFGMLFIYRVMFIIKV